MFSIGKYNHRLLKNKNEKVYKPKLMDFMLADSDNSEKNSASSSKVSQFCEENTKIRSKKSFYVSSFSKEVQKKINTPNANIPYEKEYKHQIDINSHINNISAKIKFSIETFLSAINHQEMSKRLEVAIQNLLLSILNIANYLPQLLHVEQVLKPNDPYSTSYRKQNGFEGEKQIKISGYKKKQIMAQKSLQRDQRKISIDFNEEGNSEKHIKIEQGSELQVLNQQPSAEQEASNIQSLQSSLLQDATSEFLAYNQQFNRYGNNQNKIQNNMILNNFVRCDDAQPAYFQDSPDQLIIIENDPQDDQIESEIGIQQQPSKASILKPFNSVRCPENMDIQNRLGQMNFKKYDSKPLHRLDHYEQNSIQENSISQYYIEYSPKKSYESNSKYYRNDKQNREQWLEKGQKQKQGGKEFIYSHVISRKKIF